VIDGMRAARAVGIEVTTEQIGRLPRSTGTVAEADAPPSWFVDSYG
jgi:hypothetical protein